MTFHELQQEIREKSYACVPVDVTQEELDAAARAFLGFLTLPLHTKEKFFFRIDEESHRTQVGYVRRHRDKGDADCKEYFHYHALSLKKFDPLLDENDERARNFLFSAENIFQKASHALRNVLSVFEEPVPGITKTFFESHEFPSFYLRFLKYDVRGPGNFLARGHYDTGAMTLALAESARGLRVGRHDKDLKEVGERSSGQALFMPALRFRELSPALIDFAPAWHDVVQKNTDTYSETIARWAIVFFADPTHINRLTTQEAHTPNYNVSTAVPRAYD